MTTFYRFSVNSHNDVVSKYGTINYPYATTFETNLSTNIHRMFVWKIDYKNHTIDNVVTCSDKRYFARKSDGELISEDMDNVVFLDGHFYSTSDIEQKYKVQGIDIISYDLAVRVYKENGVMIKQIVFEQYNVHDELYCSFRVSQRKLFISIEGNHYVFNGTLQSFYEGNDTDHTSFTEIPQIYNVPTVIFKKLTIGSSYLTIDNNGNNQLVYKKVQFF